MATLYLVGTPIGNLEDITLRAVRVLSEVGLVAAEDTRRTRKLFARHGIATPLTSYDEQGRHTKLRRILERLREGDVDDGILNDDGFGHGLFPARVMRIRFLLLPTKVDAILPDFGIGV